MDEVKPIVRTQTPQEKEDFIDISRRRMTPENILRGKIAVEEQKANSPQIPFEKKIPYPTSSVIEDFHKAVKLKELSIVGYLGNKKLPERDIERIEKEALESIDWAHYRDIKNFDLIDEKEIVDDDLTKKNPGKTIFVRSKYFKLKGHFQTYILMESKEEAIRRAK